MIEVTDEMKDAYDDAAWENPVELGGLEMANVGAGLAAVLALVERDYIVRRPHPAPFMYDRPHAFVRSDDPQFGAAFGGACAAEVDGITCGWPAPFHLAPW